MHQVASTRKRFDANLHSILYGQMSKPGGFAPAAGLLISLLLAHSVPSGKSMYEQTNFKRIADLVAVCLLAAFTVSVKAQVQAIPAAAQLAAKDLSETYRLRVENILYGRVEVSIDGGTNYFTVGRVLHPSTAPMPDKTSKEAGSVLRGSSEGFAFGVAPQFAMKIRPSQPPSVLSRTGKAADAEIITTVGAEKGLFTKLLPIAGSRVMFNTAGHTAGGFPETYSVSTSDIFTVVVSLPLPAVTASPALGASTSPSDAERLVAFQHAVRAQFESVAAEYHDGAIQRAVSARRKVASGTLTIRPSLPADEPETVTAVTYAVDETVVCARTTSPYLFAWDTTSVSDDEHVVEVRALNSNGTVITKLRYLVVINNHKTAP